MPAFHQALPALESQVLLVMMNEDRDKAKDLLKKAKKIIINISYGGLNFFPLKAYLPILVDNCLIRVVCCYANQAIVNIIQ